jgi:hypothetical protein
MQIHGVLLCAYCSVFQQRRKLVSCCAAGTAAEMGQNQLVKHNGFKLSVWRSVEHTAKLPGSPRWWWLLSFDESTCEAVVSACIDPSQEDQLGLHYYDLHLLLMLKKAKQSHC